MTIVGWRLYFSDWFTAWMIVFVHLPDYPDYSFNIYKYQTKLINSKKKSLSESHDCDRQNRTYLMKVFS